MRRIAAEAPEISSSWNSLVSLPDVRQPETRCVIGHYAACARNVRSCESEFVECSATFCWSHVRRQFYEIQVKTPAPIATQALVRIAALYAIEADSAGTALLASSTTVVSRSTPMSSSFPASGSSWESLARGGVDDTIRDFKPELHGDIVAMYCQAYSDFREACAYIGVKGAIVKDDSGKVFTNPYVPVRDAAVKQMVLIGSKLGLGPDDNFQVSWDDYAPTARSLTHDGEGPASDGGPEDNGELPGTVAE
jgi:P27 family predicted phage terminase small subunit